MIAEDIVYTPLDLPPCPSVNLEKLQTWLQRTYPQTELLKYTHRKIIARHSDQQEYSWDTTFAKALNWRNNFHKEFPEIVEYVTSGWGFDDKDILGLILLPKRIDKTSKGFWHSDADRLGLRFYMAFEDIEADKLLFKKTLKFEIKDSNLFRYFDDESLLEKKIYEAKLVHNRQPFYINNYAAGHTVYNSTDKYRVAVILGTAYEMSKNINFKEKIDQMIVRSAMKYYKEAIFWHDWSDGLQY
jgi:hypothetical protein